MADAEVKIARTQAKVDKERQTAQRRAMDDLRRTTENASIQFRPQPGADVPRPAASPEAAREPAKDVFLSHASEDKDEIARPLKEALESRGISVWFDEIQIQVGQSIRQRIEHGIANCRFGVVVVSPHFFAKQWTNAKLDALFSKKMDSGESTVLPVWHHVSKDEVMHQSPLLSGILALNSATMTVDEMADDTCRSRSTLGVGNSCGAALRSAGSRPLGVFIEDVGDPARADRARSGWLLRQDQVGWSGLAIWAA